MYIELPNAYIYIGQTVSKTDGYQIIVARNDIELITGTKPPDCDLPYADYDALVFDTETWKLSYHNHRMHWKEFYA